MSYFKNTCGSGLTRRAPLTLRIHAYAKRKPWFDIGIVRSRSPLALLTSPPSPALPTRATRYLASPSPSSSTSPSFGNSSATPTFISPSVTPLASPSLPDPSLPSSSTPGAVSSTSSRNRRTSPGSAAPSNARSSGSSVAPAASAYGLSPRQATRVSAPPGSAPGFRQTTPGPCVEDLAELACMAASTLHRHFRTLPGMSPL